MGPEKQNRPRILFLWNKFQGILQHFLHFIQTGFLPDFPPSSTPTQCLFVPNQAVFPKFNNKNRDKKTEYEMNRGLKKQVNLQTCKQDLKQAIKTISWSKMDHTFSNFLNRPVAFSISGLLLHC